jgi:hypothetical protein
VEYAQQHINQHMTLSPPPASGDAAVFGVRLRAKGGGDSTKRRDMETMTEQEIIEITKRWWVCPELGLAEKGTEAGMSWLQTTADFAQYVQAKPDEECVLQVPKKGDVFWIDYGNGHEWDKAEQDWESTPRPEHCYRWCKPKAGWRVYDVDDRPAIPIRARFWEAGQ